MLKLLFISLGSISLVLGIAGIFIPGLPTTPFLLLTAGLYARSSPKLYNKLMKHKILGEYISSYDKGMTLKTKIYSLAMMWIMVLLSVFIFFNSLGIRILVIVIAIIGTAYMAWIPIRKD